ncbi:hypothetical protein [Pedobacter sp.]|uniref:hypothetical protein n=1 Tax=Pedobacter sp. TaxID=1411316 RepID=UPI00396CEF8E
MKKATFFTLFLLISIGFFQCSFFADNIEGIKLTWHFDIYDEPSKQVYVTEGSNQVFFYKDLELYKQENVFIDEFNREHPDFDYWVYDRKKKIGRRYYRRNPEIGTKFNVDSFLYEYEFENARIYNSKEDLLISRRKKPGERRFTERYLPTSKKDYTYPDSMFFTFDDELKNIPISFSKELDSLRQSKIVKWVSVYNPTLDSKKNLIPARKFMVEINKIEDFDRKEILGYFNKFINTIK